MDRTALLTMLEDELGPLADEAGIALTDTAEGAGPSLDAVQRIIDRYPALASHWHDDLARYYLLDRIVKRLAVNMNISTGGDSFSLQQIFQNAKVLRDELQARLGFILSGDGGVDGGMSIGKDVLIVTPFLTGRDYTEGEF